MKNDMAKRVDKARIQDVKYREMPDIVVKVVCRYRAELFFKISRKTKLLRLFDAWTDRMDTSAVGNSGKKIDASTGGKTSASSTQSNGGVKLEPARTQARTHTQFIFTHNGRTLDPGQAPEEAGIEDRDEILAVELMDLTEGQVPEEIVRLRASAHAS
jgi:hypothetical protein